MLRVVIDPADRARTLGRRKPKIVRKSKNVRAAGESLALPGTCRLRGRALTTTAMQYDHRPGAGKSSAAGLLSHVDVGLPGERAMRATRPDRRWT